MINGMKPGMAIDKLQMSAEKKAAVEATIELYNHLLQNKERIQRVRAQYNMPIDALNAIELSIFNEDNSGQRQRNTFSQVERQQIAADARKNIEATERQLTILKFDIDYA